MSVRCGSLAPLPMKQGASLGRYRAVADRFTAQCRFRQRGEIRRTDQRHVAALREITDQRPGVFALDGALGAQHRHPLGLRTGAGRLDRGHRSDKGDFVLLAQIRHDQRGRGVAGDHDQVGGMRGDQFADQRHHPRDDLVLAMVAVGKEGVVGDIDIMRVGPRPDDLTQYRESAKAGIENQNRWRGCHAGILADLELPFSCYHGGAREHRRKSQGSGKPMKSITNCG